MKQVVGCIHATGTVQSLDADDVAIKYQNQVGKKVKNTMPEKKEVPAKTLVSEDCDFVVPESRELPRTRSRPHDPREGKQTTHGNRPEPGKERKYATQRGETIGRKQDARTKRAVPLSTFRWPILGLGALL